MRLTNEIVKALEYEGEQTSSGAWNAHYVWDDVPGFGIRVYPSGHKTFLLKYRNAYGKQRYHKIGVFDDISASKARKEAERLRELVRQGVDPRAAAEDLKRVFTVRELGEEYIEKYAKQQKKTWETDESRLERHVYSRWGKHAAPEVTRARVAAMHREIARGDGLERGGGKTEANRTLALVRTIYKWALRNRLLPADAENPAKGIRKYKESSRDRWVRHHEMPWVLKALPKLSNPYSEAVFWLILHTGARKSEALELQWRDVDLTANEVTFRETKNGSDHTVPLAAPMIAILEELPRIEGNPYVFAGNVEGRSLTDVRKAWYATQERAQELAAAAEPEPINIDVSDVTIHDLRRTVAAWLASAGYSELLIGRVLNHTVQTITGIYARLDDRAVRTALEAHAAALQNVQKPQNENVVPLRAGGES